MGELLTVHVDLDSGGERERLVVVAGEAGELTAEVAAAQVVDDEKTEDVRLPDGARGGVVSEQLLAPVPGH